MRNLSDQLNLKNISNEKLSAFGFIKEKDHYIYKTKLHQDQFELIMILNDSSCTVSLIDTQTMEEYDLVDVKSSQGAFVGQIKEEYEQAIQSIIENCTDNKRFYTQQAQAIIQYIQETYQDECEFLWEKVPNNAIWRNKQNRKWYGTLLTVHAGKLGLKEDKTVEILDLRYPKETIEAIIDHHNIFPGYHMNKKNWITLLLDHQLDFLTITQLIDKSYQLSLKK